MAYPTEKRLMTYNIYLCSWHPKMSLVRSARGVQLPRAGPTGAQHQRSSAERDGIPPGYRSRPWMPNGKWFATQTIPYAHWR